ncbi:MAG TPA: hypothetical protein VGM88_02570 [Kofleriaceae bacterium]|jgi:hypothetical protein
MADERPLVCGAHGESPPVFLCCHLANGIACGVHEDVFSGERHAWCDLCERSRRSAGGWSREVIELARLEVLCTGCYAEIRARNDYVPPRGRGRTGIVGGSDWLELVRAAAASCRERNAATDARWPWKGQAWTRDGGRVTFANGTEAACLPLGVWNARDAFEWSTLERGNPDVGWLRCYGLARGLDAFAFPSWKCRTLDEARAAAVVGAYLLDAPAVCSGPVAGGTAWLLLSNFRALS